MVRPSNEFHLAWSSLTSPENALGWQVIDLPSAGPLQLRAGRRSPDNAEAILVGFKSARVSASEKLPEGQGFTVEKADPDGTGQAWLALTRKSAGSVELFSTMTCDVVGALDDAVTYSIDETKLMRVLISRVSAWQEFMRKGAQALSAEAEIGLVGELLLLNAIVDAGVSSVDAVAAWVGPLDGVQDFQIGTGAIEVKSTVGAAGFVAKIGALEQLDNSTLQPLYLAGIRLRQLESGQTLPMIAEKMRSTIFAEPEAARLFAERLLAAGYVDLHAERYQRRFELGQIRLIEVTDAFPRLTRSNVPKGVLRAVYEIDLDEVSAHDGTIVTVLAEMGAVSA
jgi:hypothetical protein